MLSFPAILVYFCALVIQLILAQSAGTADYNRPAYSGHHAAPLDSNYVQPGYFVPLKHDYIVQPATGFNNTATCAVDPKCFQYSEGCTFLNCRPYNRSTPVTCEQCMNLCLSQQYSPGPYCCKSVVYDVQYRICDLFSQDIGWNMANLAKRPGHIYFQPTGLCQATAATTPASAPAICPSGQTEKLVLIKDHQLPGVTGQTVPNTADAAACARVCQSNKLPDGTPFACKSAQFTNGQCTVSTSQPVAEGSVQPSPGSTYYQKLCFTSSVAGCAEIFEEDPQKMLIGQSRQVTDANSVSNCLQACLDAQAKYGFACASAMYFVNTPTQNCILNSETKFTKPDIFTTADSATNVFYLETLCGAGGGGAASITRLRDQSLISRHSSASIWARTSNGAATPEKTGGSLWGRIKREFTADRSIRSAKSEISAPQAWN